MRTRTLIGPRERLQYLLDASGDNPYVQVSAVDLRALLELNRLAYAEGWNAAADAFGGCRIVPIGTPAGPA